MISFHSTHCVICAFVFLREIVGRMQKASPRLGVLNISRQRKAGSVSLFIGNLRCDENLNLFCALKPQTNCKTTTVPTPRRRICREKNLIRSNLIFRTKN